MLFAPGAGGMLITAVDAVAAARGLHVGQRLADARALIPGLRSAAADAAADAAALDHLADWCTRYTPWASADGIENGTAGLVLDITGCAHLFGGEEKLTADLLARLARCGVTARAAPADTPAAAWALARFAETSVDAVHAVQPFPATDDTFDHTRARAKLASLPIEGLRLHPDLTAQLRRLGLQKIGDVLTMPRAPLAARFGADVLRRLDRMFGAAHEPISPRRPVACWQARVGFADGIGRHEDIDLATRHLLDEICAMLEKAGRGARSLELACYRLDGMVRTIEIGTGKPTHQAAHLMRLFGEKLGTIELGFGIELMVLSAAVTDALVRHQSDLAAAAQHVEGDLSDIVDRLKARLGPKQVRRLVPRESHLPERAVVAAPALQPLGATGWRKGRHRPLQLFVPPEPLEVSEDGETTEAPPRSFRWRRSDYWVTKAEGPERIEPEWWRGGAKRAARDYFWIQDAAGRRFWIYRNRGGERRWYLHGLFA